MFRRFVLAAVIAALGQADRAAAQGNSGGNGNRGGGNQGGNGNRGNGSQGSNGHRGGSPSFGDPDRAIVQTGLSANPGFSVQPLPPGMRNRIARGKALPPGIARRSLPHGLLGQLPQRPGYSYAYVGATLLLIEVATGAVADILADVLLR
jgi:hypothetical protein